MIEAGVTGALVAAGVDTEVALAGVLVSRFITSVLPIVIGPAGSVLWRVRRVPADGGDPLHVERSVHSGRDVVH